MAQITYTNKVALNENPEIADINKVSDDDMNEIKSVVNENFNENITISNTTPVDLDSVKLFIDTGEVSSSASEITNEYSTSTGIGYSANYVNNLQPKVLYENNSGAGKTANITLNDDVDNYEWFIFYGFDDDNSSVKMTIPFYKVGTGNLKGSYFDITSSGGAWTTRNYTYSGAVLTYSNQYYYTLAQGSVFSYANFRVTKIVGYK